MKDEVAAILDRVRVLLAGRPVGEQVEVLNGIKQGLGALSPLATEPVDVVVWVPMASIRGNAYNPNKVAPPEMALLHESIAKDGFTQPVVTYRLPDGDYEIVDGFHRNRIGRECPDITDRVKGFLPVVVINKPLDERMGSTIRHNRARGVHQIRSLSNMVVWLAEQGWDDATICQRLGMSVDEVLRLKQVSGLQAAFANHTFSKSWDEFESQYYSDEKGKVDKTVARKPVRNR